LQKPVGEVQEVLSVVLTQDVVAEVVAAEVTLKQTH
jgi:hypothetical protein